MASAEVQIDSSGTSRPERASRAARSRGVKIELLVSTRKRPLAFLQAREELGRPGQRVLLAHEHAVHVGEPALGVGAHACGQSAAPVDARSGGAARRSSRTERRRRAAASDAPPAASRRAAGTPPAAVVSMTGS